MYYVLFYIQDVPWLIHLIQLFEVSIRVYTYFF